MKAAVLLATCVLASCGYGSYVHMPSSACRADFCRRAGGCCPTLAELDGTVKPRQFSDGCVLLENGRVLCSDRNRDGAAGIGRVAVGKDMPWLAVRDIDDGIELATDAGSSRCVVRTGGAVDCWGNNTHGQIGGAPGVHRARPGRVLAVGSASAVEFTEGAACALRESGEVVCWGLGVRILRGFIDAEECPRDRRGRYACWGPRGKRVMIADAIDLAGSLDGFCAALSNGQVHCWARDRKMYADHQPHLPWVYPPAALAGARDVVALDGNVGRIWALDTGGHMSFWGRFSAGASASSNACEVIPSVPVHKPWRIDDFGDITAIANECGLRSDGRVVCWTSRSGAELVDDLGGVTSLIPGLGPRGERCARDAQGEVWCWRDGAPPVRWSGLPDPFASKYRDGSECSMQCPAFAQMGWSWATEPAQHATVAPPPPRG
ncbi:RCC1 domain-containing protein [Nannocystis punicea]|uniref:Regulator of chromosome condensation (RCC1) repeat-containing protein n=1 Tax=Nannocystis punicea TaxID=2995304 RepID=A0ABY7GVR8_9BACT|nr:hypothetical protein [Nannocystis poenicansa]WAS90909.1 hypothetical protein O0S08_32370 [Nannocystis poenicansa]